MRVRSTQLYCIVYRLKNALSKVHFCVQTPRRSLGYFGLRSLKEPPPPGAQGTLDFGLLDFGVVNFMETVTLPPAPRRIA